MPSSLSSLLQRTALCALLTVSALPAFATDEPQAIIAKLTPATGWKAPEAARIAAGDELFDLIDGGAELYHEYGFKRALSWQLEAADRTSIQVELYEMSDPAAAYGVFSLMQTGKFVRGNLGQGSLRFGYYTVFWSGPYYASVTGAKADAATQAEVDRLAAQLAELLPRDQAEPAWFTRLPAADLQERKYFRGRIGLSNIATGPAGELAEAQEGLLATYPGAQLLLLHYPTATAAAEQLARAARAAALIPELGPTAVEPDGFTSFADGGPRLRGFAIGTDVFLLSGEEEQGRDLERQLRR
jgi:hypothetical protein